MTDFEPKEEQQEATPQGLLELLQSKSGTCVPILDWELPEESPTPTSLTVGLTSISMLDILNNNGVGEHLLAADEAPSVTVDFHMPEWRFGFDSGDPSFAISRNDPHCRMTLPDGESNTARLVHAKYPDNMHVYWLTLGEEPRPPRHSPTDPDMPF